MAFLFYYFKENSDSLLELWASHCSWAGREGLRPSCLLGRPPAMLAIAAEAGAECGLNDPDPGPPVGTGNNLFEAF
jgi:hypothetical protein